MEIKAKTSFILATIYRASYTNLLTETEKGCELEDQLSKAASKSNRIIITGDLNCDTSSEIPDKSTNSLIELLETNSESTYIKTDKN